MSTDTLSQEPLLPNQPFFSWLRTQTGLFTSQIFAILTLISALASLIYSVIKVKSESGQMGSKSIGAMVIYAHLLFLVVFIIALIQVLDDNDRGSYRVRLVYDRVFGGHLTPRQTGAFLKRSKAQLKRFKICFLLFWCSMFLLYVGFAFKYGVELSIQPNTLSNVQQLTLSFIPFALNNLSLLFVFWCFVVLYLPAKRSDYVFDKLRKKLHHKHAIQSRSNRDSKDTAPYSQWASKLFALGLSAAFLVLKQNRFLRQGLLMIISLIVITGLTLSFWVLLPDKTLVSTNSIQNYTAILNTLSGILNAIVLALLIARLDSKLIGLPSWLICILYLYAAVQPLFFAFEIFPPIATSVLIVVFIFKIYFFFIIMYTLQTGRMLNYFFCSPFVGRRLARLRKSEGPAPKRLISAQSSELTRQLSLVLGILGLGWLWFLLPYFARQVAWANYKGVFAGWVMLKLTFDGLHVFFALVIIFVIVRLLFSKNEDGHTIERVCRGFLNEPLPQPEALDRSSKQLSRLKVHFLLFWVAILGLYLALAYKHVAERNEPAQELADKLVEPQFFGELWERGLILALNNLSLLFLFSCFLVLYLPALDGESDRKQKLLFRYGLFFVVMLTLAFFALITLPALQGLTRQNMDAYTIVFNGISGTLNAVALALLIARLDSKLFDISSFLIFILLTYASIQPLFVIFEGRDKLFVDLQTLVVFSALLFKLCFFLIMMDTWRTGTMRTYLLCFPQINKRIDSIFENQFEFKTSRERERGFNLSILKKNTLVYTTDSAFDSRANCDETAQRLRQLMRDRENYDFREEAGTHWVVVNDDKDDISLCESIPLRSRDEAEKLVKESVDKVPYCKYNRG
jgi:hypothetical protein